MSHCRSLVFTTFLCVIACEGRKSASKEAVWVYEYPYAQDGACVCKESQIGSYQNFTSEGDCLEAFKEDVNEYCSIEEGGLTDDQCDDVISQSTLKTNADCVSDCGSVITGELTAEQFLKKCGLEPVVEFGSAVAVSEHSCFNSYVYGYGDFDPHNQNQEPPLSLLGGVPSAAKCQGLCQKTPGCVAFTWRALDDDEQEPASNPFLSKTVFDFQNPAKTCILFEDAHMRTVTRAALNTQSILSGPTRYCNVAKVEACILASSNNSNSFLPFQEKPCLLCDCAPRCVYQTGKHISGPAWCGTGLREVCHFGPPPPPPTPTPCPNCPSNPSCPPTSPATRPPRPQCPDNCVDDCEDDYDDIDDCFPDC